MKRQMFMIFTFVAACGGEFNPDLGDLDSSGTTSDAGTDDGSTGGTDDGSTGDTGDSIDMGTPDGCGDGEAQGMEECDGLDLRGTECTAFPSPGNGNYSGGQLGCNEDCTLDHGSCTYCGDGVKNNPSEECDGMDMGALTCEDEGFDGGELSCDAQCGLVEAACESCEGDKTGMYGTQADAACGGVTGNLGFPFSVCLPSCEVDADCVDPDLAVCENQPVCDSNVCFILCEMDGDCPGGMRCQDAYGYCVWEI